MREFLSEILDEHALVGEGMTSEVFSWEDNAVLKLFHAWFPRSQVLQEFSTAQAVHRSRVPAPNARELLQVGDRLGIVFDRIHGPSMLAAVQAKPWRLFAAARQLATLQHGVAQHPAPEGLPGQRERIQTQIAASRALDESTKLRALEKCAALPGGGALCHGDFHPNNLIFTPNGVVIIDWQAASRGNLAGDIARTSRLLRCANLPPKSPAWIHLLLRLTRGLLHRAYLTRALRLHGISRADLAAWEEPLAAAATGWKSRLPTDAHNLLEAIDIDCVESSADGGLSGTCDK